MSARIISLPTAVSEPVKQTRRYGRYPKQVVSLRRVIRERAYERYKAIERGKNVQFARNQAASLYAQAEHYRGMADGMEACYRESGLCVIFEEETENDVSI
jgi:hypothetical protein